MQVFGAERGRIRFLHFFAACLPLLGLACADRGGPDAPAFVPISEGRALFWDRQTTETADILDALAAEFNASWPGLPVAIEQSGNYTDIFRKVTASIQAGKLPGMSVAYESMMPGYVRSNAVVAMDSFIEDPVNGLSEEELADFFPVVLATNTFDEFDGKMYSFPFTKSVLMLMYNKRVLAQAGIDSPPRTWDEFLEQCRQVKAKTGKYAWAIDLDASTIDGMIFSMGGEVYREGKTLFDQPASVRVFELLETLVAEELAYQIPPRSFNDESALAQDKIAFSLRSSSGRTHFALLFDDPDAWGMTTIPQADPADPHTVLYGANVCVFNTTAEQRAASWAFIKFFTSLEVSVRWSLETGYVPIRKSAAQHPDMQRFWGEWEHNRAPFDCLQFAKAEPNVGSWQEIRGLIEKAETAVLVGLKTGRQAALDLKEQADAVLKADFGRYRLPD